jgi:hypothetical protein
MFIVQEPRRKLKTKLVYKRAKKLDNNFPVDKMME